MAIMQLTVPIAAGAFIISALYVIVKAVYLAFFHPLARYPGPFLAKFTNAYAAYHGWKGDIHLDAWRCYQKYGDHVRYGPNQLLFNTVEGLKDIYSSGSASTFIKGEGYTPLIHRSPNILTIWGGKEHARRRRIMAQGVSDKAQREYEKRITTHIDKLCKTAYSSPQPLDMSEWCYYLSFDIMADVVFGAQYNLLGNEKFRYVTEVIKTSNMRMSTLVQFPRFAALKIDKYFFRAAILARNRFIRFVSRVVKERLDRQTMLPRGGKDQKGGDVFAHLAAATDPETGESFSLNEIAAESTTLIVAGADTSSTALSAVFFYLANNRSAYDKAAAEVRAAFKSSREVVSGAELASCKYLRSCVTESMRMSPPVGSPLWRQAQCDTVVDGQPIPAGCVAGVSIYAIHHNPRYFDDAFEYKPERWLGTDPDAERTAAATAYNPFSMGTRGCLGKALATTEILLTMATVLFKGDFELVTGEQAKIGRGHPNSPLGRHRINEYQLWDYITGQTKGPVLQFFPRNV